MSFSHTLGVTYRTPEGLIASTTAIYTGPQEIGLDDTVPGMTTDQEFDLAFTIGQVISLVIWSDKAVTLKTNDSGSPQDTIVLVAGRQVVWNTDQPVPPPFSDDVTTFFVTNAGGSTAKFKFRALLDAEAP